MTHKQEYRRVAIIEGFYQGLNHEEIKKKVTVSVCTISKVISEHLKEGGYTQKTNLEQVKAIEKKLFYHLEKENRTVKDISAINELTPIYARFCAT